MSKVQKHRKIRCNNAEIALSVVEQAIDGKLEGKPTPSNPPNPIRVTPLPWR